jgi:Ca2+/Na+ antiporter
VPDVLWTLAWFLARPHKFDEVPKCFFIIELVGLICGFAWTYYVSGLLIDLLSMIGVITKLSPTYLALTIIGAGNALPDALITIALAK